MSEELVSSNLMGTLVAHPSTLHCFDDTLVAPGLPGIHSIYAGADWEFFRPVVLHDRIAATARLVDVEEKKGSFCGDMVLQTGQVIYENQLGERVAACTPYVMRTSRHAARDVGKYAGIERYRYNTEDLQAIDDAYETEEIRGDVPRYWEDVQAGDPVPPIIKGPLSSDDMLNFVDIVRGTLTFAAFHEHRRRHPQDVYWDPETGMPDSWDASLIKDSVAREFGFPFAHDTGIQRVCWLENMVTNWMSNLGFLSSLKVRLVRPQLHLRHDMVQGTRGRQGSPRWHAPGGPGHLVREPARRDHRHGQGHRGPGLPRRRRLATLRPVPHVLFPGGSGLR